MNFYGHMPLGGWVLLAAWVTAVALGYRFFGIVGATIAAEALPVFGLFIGLCRLSNNQQRNSGLGPRGG